MARGWFGPHTAFEKGERNRELREAFWRGETPKELCRRFGISRARLYQIVEKGAKVP